MFKKFIAPFIIFLIGFTFTTNSFAIILQNLPTNSNSVQQIPIDIISNMSKNFDIIIYNSNSDAQNFSDPIPTNESSVSNSDSKTDVNQNDISKKTINYNFWYWLVTIIFIVFFILFWFIRKLK